jgi:hypothetical protein
VQRLSPYPSVGFWRGRDRAIRHGDVITTNAVHGTVAASIAWVSASVSDRRSAPRLSVQQRTRPSAQREKLLSGLRPSRCRTRGLRASDASDAGVAASVGCDRHVCCVGANAKFSNGRYTWRFLVASDVGSASVTFVGRAMALLSETPL